MKGIGGTIVSPIPFFEYLTMSRKIVICVGELNSCIFENLVSASFCHDIGKDDWIQSSDKQRHKS